MTRVLLVGKGEPEKGGIAAFLDMLMSSPLRDEFDMQFLNLARPLGTEMGTLSFANIRRTLLDVLRVFRASRAIDVVHIHTAFVPAVTIIRSGLLIAAARLARASAVVHVHGGLLPGWVESGGSRRLVSVALGRASAVVAVSFSVHAVLERILGLGAVELIQNGVETQRFTPAGREPAAPPVIGFVGFLTKRKGLLDLFEASRLLAGRGVAHRVVVVGGTPTEGAAESDEMRRMAPDTVEFRGAVDRDDMAAAYGSFEVFCLPSWWEAAPLSVLEAMSCGLPVVATDVGEIPSMVEDTVSGMLVPVRDPVRLADALETVLTAPGLMRSMGHKGRERAVEHFEWGVVLARIARLYRDSS